MPTSCLMHYISTEMVGDTGLWNNLPPGLRSEEVEEGKMLLRSHLMA